MARLCNLILFRLPFLYQYINTSSLPQLHFSSHVTYFIVYTLAATITVMSRSLGQQMARTMGIFQALLALPAMIHLASWAMWSLFEVQMPLYDFMYVSPRVPSSFLPAPKSFSPPLLLPFPQHSHTPQRLNIQRLLRRLHNLHRLRATLSPNVRSHHPLLRIRQIWPRNCDVVVVTAGLLGWAGSLGRLSEVA